MFQRKNSAHSSNKINHNNFHQCMFSDIVTNWLNFFCHFKKFALWPKKSNFMPVYRFRRVAFKQFCLL